MCIAAPARIVGLDASEATVEAGGRRRRASLLLVPDVRPGDWVLVAAGNVVRRIDAAEAADQRSLLDSVAGPTAGREGGTR